jgi:hypothetical protein
MYWLRVLGIKHLTTQAMTDVEEKIHQALIGKSFSIPEPLFLALKAIGKVKLATGEVIVPTLPDLPCTTTKNVPGTLGIVTPENHSIYEELPVIGPTVEALLQRSKSKDRATYASVLAPKGATASVNLQGFAPLNSCKNEALATLHDLGIDADGPFRNIRNTGFNYKILDFVSEYLQTTETFKVFVTNPLTVPETGSVGQIIQAIPDVSQLDPLSRAGDN